VIGWWREPKSLEGFFDGMGLHAVGMEWDIMARLMEDGWGPLCQHSG